MIISQNKKAYLEYEISEKVETGIVLTGEEIKSVRAHRVNLNGTFCRIQNGEAYVLNMHILSEEPERTRKLLMHKSEIENFYGKTQQKGYALIPLKLYLSKGKAKLEIGLARGKKLYDHRETIKKKDIVRQTERDLKD